MRNVNGFFRTKLAEKKKEDPLIDPGEAGAAGLAIAYGPFAQKTFPLLAGTALTHISDIGEPWAGDTVHGLKDLRGRRDYSKKQLRGFLDDIDSQAKGLGFHGQDRDLFRDLSLRRMSITDKLVEKANKPRKILGGLFNVKPMPVREGFFTANPERVANLVEMQHSVNYMLDKYKLPEKGVTISLKGGVPSMLSGPSYDFVRKEIAIPKVGKESFLHEIGHAAHLTRKGARAADLARKILHQGSNIAIPISFIAGDEIQKMFPGEIDDKAIKFVQDHAPAIISSTYAAATVYPEVQATVRAVQHVKNTEGSAAAKKTFKKLLPPLLSYIVPVIPSIIGVGMARKWHREAKEKEKELQGILEKESSYKAFISDFVDQVSYVGKQVASQTKDLFRKPIKESARDLYTAGKNVSGSPEFAAGAALVGIPTALTAYVSLNTPHGHVYREQARKYGFKGEEEYQKGKRQEKNILTPAIVGITSAISGGFINKLFTDIYKVL